MAFLEGTRASREFMCLSTQPDVCLTANGSTVPFHIFAYFDRAVGFSPDVRFRKQFAFHHKSRLSAVEGNEKGVGGGVKSGVNLGYCRPIPGTHSKNVQVNGSFVDYHAGTYMYMNCAGPEGPWNTKGQVIFLGNMESANPPVKGEIKKGSFFSLPGIFGNIADLAEKAKSIYDTGKKLYAIAETDWSDPSSVLGAIAGLAGIADLQKTAEALNTARGFYDLGDKVLNTDFSDPRQVLSTIAGVASVANMDDLAMTAQIAGSINDAIRADWKDPQAAIAAATGIIKNSGLDRLAIEMADNSGIDLGFLPPLMNNLPAMFPIPGSAGAQAAPQTTSTSSNAAKPGEPLTKAAVNELAGTSPIAYQRFQALPKTDHGKAAGTLVEFSSNSTGPQATAIPANNSAALYIPTNGESNPQQLSDGSGDPASNTEKLKEVFVASQDSTGKGQMFGIREQDGEVYLFGGTVSPDSKPESGKSQPAPGSLDSWWITESALGNQPPAPANQSPEGNSDREDFMNVLQQMASSFDKGEPKSPLRLPLDSINGGGSSLAGTLSAAKESLIGVKDELSEFGTEVYDSVGDFYNDLFGDETVAPEVAAGSSASGQSTGGSAGGGGGAGGGASAAGSLSLSGAKPNSGAAPPSVGVDGILITITQGNPAAASAAIEASFRAANASALDKALKEEEARKKAEEAVRAEEKARKRAEEAKRKAEEEASNGDATDDEVAQLLDEFDEAEKRDKENKERAAQRRREQNSFSTTMPQDFDDADEVGTGHREDSNNELVREPFLSLQGEDELTDRLHEQYLEKLKRGEISTAFGEVSEGIGFAGTAMDLLSELSKNPQLTKVVNVGGGLLKYIQPVIDGTQAYFLIEPEDTLGERVGTVAAGVAKGGDDAYVSIAGGALVAIVSLPVTSTLVTAGTIAIIGGAVIGGLYNESAMDKGIDKAIDQAGDGIATAVDFVDGLFDD